MRLVKADEAQKRARDLLAHEAWGQKLTPAQFVDREIQLRSHPWAARNMDTWLLLDDDNTALSSCETFRMRSRLRREDGNTYGIASVYTQGALRGRGYAVRMLQDLMEHLLKTDPAAHASVLYSDVGAPIYERCGYRVCPAWDWVFPSEAGALSGVELLTADQLQPALQRHVSVDDFVVVPALDQVDWHLERERIYVRLLGGNAGPPWRGALGNKGGAVTWVLNLKSAELLVLTLHAVDSEELEGFLKTAAAVAHACGIPTVKVWETPDLERRAPSVVTRVARDGSLPMFRPLNGKVDQWRCIPRALWV